MGGCLSDEDFKNDPNVQRAPADQVQSRAQEQAPPDAGQADENEDARAALTAKRKAAKELRAKVCMFLFTPMSNCARIVILSPLGTRREGGTEEERPRRGTSGGATMLLSISDNHYFLTNPAAAAQYLHLCQLFPDLWVESCFRTNPSIISSWNSVSLLPSEVLSRVFRVSRLPLVPLIDHISH